MEGALTAVLMAVLRQQLLLREARREAVAPAPQQGQHGDEGEVEGEAVLEAAVRRQALRRAVRGALAAAQGPPCGSVARAQAGAFLLGLARPPTGRERAMPTPKWSTKAARGRVCAWDEDTAYTLSDSKVLQELSSDVEF